jgi:transposase
MLSNAIRGHAAEFGVTGAKGPQKITELLERIAGAGARIAEQPGQPAGRHRGAAGGARGQADGASQSRSAQPVAGEDPRRRAVTAVSIALKVPDATVFRSGRHFAAWLGITPRELAATIASLGCMNGSVAWAAAIRSSRGCAGSCMMPRKKKARRHPLTICWSAAFCCIGSPSTRLHARFPMERRGRWPRTHRPRASLGVVVMICCSESRFR